MPWCLVPSLADKFKKDIISGEINPEKLMEMSSKERHSFFAERLGEENAEPINRLFESKIILKNQQRGMISWATKVMSDSPQAKRDIISRIQRMDSVLDSESEKSFLEDLAAWKLGTRVTFEEAQKISELSDKIEETQNAMADGGDRLEYGRAFVQLQNYVNDLKLNDGKLSLADIKANPLRSAGHIANEIAGNGKAIQSSMDNSAIFRQGWKTLWTHPNIWRKNAVQSFKNIANTFGVNNVMDELHADIVSRPNYDLMKTGKLDVGVGEEAFPASLPGKIPYIGRVYHATEAAYTAFVQKTRADVFDKYIDIARKSDVELTDTELRSIGKMVNSLTGRGHLGSLEGAGKVVNNVFFSPKFVKSHIDVLTQPLTGGEGSSFVRKQAAYNLIKVISGSAAILAIAKILKPDSVDFDPRSVDFGKIRVGDTRFDVTGGMGSLAVLAARLATSQTKSSVTGSVKDLNAADKSGKPLYGSPTKLDVVEDFFQNKLSPVGNIFKDFLKGQTFDQQKPTVAGEALSFVTPMPVKNAMELWKSPKAAPFVIGVLADGLGINTNTYGLKEKNAEELEKYLKQASTDDIIEFIKTDRGNNKDTSDLERRLRQKAQRARSGGTLTSDEVERIKKVLPDFNLSPRVRPKK